MNSCDRGEAPPNLAVLGQPSSVKVRIHHPTIAPNRMLKRHGISHKKTPSVKKPQGQAYDPGFVHIDVKYFQAMTEEAPAVLVRGH